MNESYNKYINKTEDEILSCSDIVQLSQWKGVLEEKIAQAKISIGNIRSKGKGRLSSEKLSRVNLLIENRAGSFSIFTPPLSIDMLRGFCFLCLLLNIIFFMIYFMIFVSLQPHTNDKGYEDTEKLYSHRL